MRSILLIILIVILSTYVSALTLHSTEMPGENPSIYGSIIAFETHEDHAKQDLNDDGDTGDRIIQYYDLESKTTISTKTTGKNPQVFAYYIVFETSESEEEKDLNNDGDESDSILQYYNIHEQKTINTKLTAQNPYLYQYLVTFSTPEKQLEIDYNNDGDTDDSVIQYYDLKTQETTITDQTGEFPVTNGKRIFFLTDENKVKMDLNDDGDEYDRVFQIYSIETKNSFSTKTIGAKSTINKQGVAAYREGNRLTIYDVEGNEKQELNILADDARIRENNILYSYDNRLNAYILGTKTKSLTEIYGQKPDIFENTVVFQTDEEYTGDLNKDGDQKDTVIRYAILDDRDDDGLYDLLDNCPTITNSNQSDLDNDGIGDECDSKLDIELIEIPDETVSVDIQQPAIEKISETKREEKTKEKNSWGIWFGILLILAIIIIAAIFLLPGYYKRKKKSFGF